MWYMLLQNRGNSGLLGNPVYYSLLGGGGGGGHPPAPLWSPPVLCSCIVYLSSGVGRCLILRGEFFQ